MVVFLLLALLSSMLLLEREIKRRKIRERLLAFYAEKEEKVVRMYGNVRSEIAVKSQLGRVLFY